MYAMQDLIVSSKSQ